MSDHDAAPDPIDKAYVQAEALLSDDDARAARRARVLAAVAREPVAPPAATSTSMRRPVWRRGGWLAAASVVGLGLFVSAHFYAPAGRQPLTETVTPSLPTPSAPTPSAQGTAVLSTPAARVPSQTPEPAPRTFAAAPPVATASPPDTHPAAPPPPPVLSIAPARRAFPAAPPPPDVVVMAERRAQASAANDPGLVSGGARDEAADAQRSAREAAKQPSPAFAPPPPAAPLSRFKSSAGLLSDPAARLRAAAAAGRTAELQSLLDQGVPIDAPDADGDTALMKSIQADQPAAAALLRRRGASLDHKNHAGERARDMAMAKGDAELNQAIGLAP